MIILILIVIIIIIFFIKTKEPFDINIIPTEQYKHPYITIVKSTMDDPLFKGYNIDEINKLSKVEFNKMDKTIYEYPFPSNFYLDNIN